MVSSDWRASLRGLLPFYLAIWAVAVRLPRPRLGAGREEHRSHHALRGDAGICHQSGAAAGWRVAPGGAAAAGRRGRSPAAVPALVLVGGADGRSRLGDRLDPAGAVSGRVSPRLLLLPGRRRSAAVRHPSQPHDPRVGGHREPERGDDSLLPAVHDRGNSRSLTTAICSIAPEMAAVRRGCVRCCVGRSPARRRCSCWSPCSRWWGAAAEGRRPGERPSLPGAVGGHPPRWVG